MKSRILRSTLATLLAVIAAACGPTTTTGPTVSSITVALQDSSIPAGIGTTITATAKMSDGKTKDITTLASWKSSSTTTALAACTVSPCPVTTIAAGTATFTATYGGKSASADLTVTSETLKSINVTASRTSFAKGATSVLAARGTFSDASVKDITSQVTWTSSAAAVTIAGSTATGAEVGTATVTATLNNVSGTLGLTVVAAEPVSLAISPSPLNVPVGSSVQLVASITYSDNSSANVASTATWTSSVPAKAAVSTTGLLQALAQGTTVITATSGNLTATITANVGAPTITSISITPTPVVLLVGRTQQLTATALLSDSTTENVTMTATWTTDDATVATVSSTGLLSTVGAGNTIVTATVGDISGTVAVTATMASITSIDVSPATVDLPLGSTRALTATAHLDNNSTQDVSAVAVWTSSSPADVLVSATGVLTASTITTSAVTITAAVGDVSGTASVTVSAPILDTLAVTPAAPSVVAGFTVELTATGTLTDGTTEDDTETATWTTSNSDIADVDADGVVTTKLVGSVTITATVGTHSATATITVTAPIISSIVVEPATASIPLGHTRQLAVKATMSNGTITTVTSQTAWTSDDATNAIATISAGGLVSTVDDSATTVTFTATVGTHTATCVVTVLPPVLESISIDPPTVSLAAGLTKQLAVVGHLSDGTTEDDSVGTVWSSDDTAEAFASISTTGLVTTKVMKITPVTITATFGTFTATSTVFITAATPTAITVSPDSATLPAGRTRALLVSALLTDGNTSDVTSQVSWTSDDATGAIAKISGAGVVTAVATSATPVVFTATLGALTDDATITVDPAVVDSVAITPSPLSVIAGRARQLTAEEVFSDATRGVVTISATWSSSDEDIATVDAAGLLTTYLAGTVTIHALSTGVTGDLVVTVTAPVVDSIALVPSTLDLPLGASSQLVLNATLSNGVVEDRASSATWTTSDETLVTVSSTGLVRGAAESATGATITATLGEFTATSTVTVSAPVIASVTIDPSPASLALGRTLQLNANAIYTDGSSTDITATAVWTSNDIGIVKVVGGLLTSASTGTTSVRAEVTSGGISGTTNVTVLPAELTGISVSAAQTTLPKGVSAALKVVASYSDGTSSDVTGDVLFSSGNEATATVSAAGVVTAVDVGTAAITVTYGEATGSVSFDVVQDVTALTIVPGPSLNLPQSQSVDLNVVATLSDSSTLDVTALTGWSFDATTDVAELESDGTLTGLVPGTVGVVASVGGQTGTLALTVTRAISSIAAQPSSFSLPQTLTRSVKIVATLNDASTLDVTQLAKWQTADVTGTVKVDTTGLFKAVGNDGVPVTFQAVVGGAFVANIAVTPVAAIDSIAVSPDTFTLYPLLSRTVSVVATLADASTLDLTSQVTWTTSDAGQLTASRTGTKITAVAGSATPVTFTAHFGDRTATTVVTVPEVTVRNFYNPSFDGTSIAPNATVQLRPKIEYSDFTEFEAESGVIWTSSDPRVSVSSTGLVKGLELTEPNAAIITASLTYGSFTGSLEWEITVWRGFLSEITVTPVDPTISSSVQLSAFGKFSFFSDVDITSTATWSSTDTNVATVNSTGFVTCVGNGPVTIKAEQPQAPGFNLVTGSTIVNCDP